MLAVEEAWWVCTKCYQTSWRCTPEFTSWCLFLFMSPQVFWDHPFPCFLLLLPTQTSCGWDQCLGQLWRSCFWAESSLLPPPLPFITTSSVLASSSFSVSPVSGELTFLVSFPLRPLATFLAFPAEQCCWVCSDTCPSPCPGGWMPSEGRWWMSWPSPTDVLLPPQENPCIALSLSRTFCLQLS